MGEKSVKKTSAWSLTYRENNGPRSEVKTEQDRVKRLKGLWKRSHCGALGTKLTRFGVKESPYPQFKAQGMVTAEKGRG